MAHHPNPKIAKPRHDLVECYYGHPANKLRWTGEVRCLPDQIGVPLHWKRPRRIFVCNQADLFHDQVPDDFIEAVFGVISLAGRHTFQLLTKRPERMRSFLSGTTLARCQAAAVVANVEIRSEQGRRQRVDEGVINGPWPLPNMMLGVSVEDRRARQRITELEQIPAAVRFVSCEPLLEDLGDLCLRETNMDWVIIGGESGPRARPCDLAWIRSLVQQCRVASVPCFVKQLGAAASDPPNGVAGAALKVPDEAAALISRRLRDRKGGDPSEWPEDLRVRQMPEVVRHG